MSQSTVGVDFTLENVQYKFATIIGELCGKPSVLSQFAVWLDMRLAEYKLKGSISLDCSGLKPDPDWLQGLKDSIPPKITHTTTKDRLTSDHQARSRLTRERPSSHHTPPHRRTVDHSNQGSPEILVIKEEPGNDNHQDDVFPVGFHENDSKARVERKRHADNSIVDSSLILSPVKSPRFSSTLPQSSHDGLTNTSALSSHDQSMSHIDDSELEQFIQDSNNSYSRGHNSAGYMDQGGNNSAEFFSGTVLMDNSMSSESTHPSDVQSSHIDDQQRTASSSDTEFGVYGTAVSSWERTNQGLHVPVDRNPVSQPDYSANGGIVSGLDPSGLMETSAAGLPAQHGEPPKVINSTVRNASASKSLFQRWLSFSEHNDQRCIEQIPPVQLDQYLTQFFTEAKKRNGQDYDVSSLRRIRSGLQFYLRESGYPCSIIRSPLFLRSTEAIRIRCEELFNSSRANNSNMSNEIAQSSCQ